MIKSLARQSVVLKCNMEESAMLGNYEFYYSAGLYAKLTGCAVTADLEPKELWDKIMEHKKSYTTEDGKLKHLIFMMEEYKVHEEYDDQMKELFDWGLHEDYLWQSSLPEGASER